MSLCLTILCIAGQKDNTVRPASCRRIVDPSISPTVAKNKAQQDYFVFTSWVQAIKWLQDVRIENKYDKQKLGQLAVPTFLGINELHKKVGAPLSYELMEATGNIIAILDISVSDISTISASQRRIIEDFIVHIGSNRGWINPIKHVIQWIDWSNLYAAAMIHPTPSALNYWLRGKNQISKIEVPNLLSNLTRAIAHFEFEAPIKKQLLQSFLAQESQVNWNVNNRMILTMTLSYLLQADPQTAWIFYNRHKQKFLTIDLDRPEYVIRALVYFKYVMGKNIPVIDNSLLAQKIQVANEMQGMETIVFNWLSTLGEKVEFSVMDNESSSIEMDMLYTTKGGRKINIEIDGPQHFIKMSDGELRLRPKDIRRDEILNAMGIEVYRIPFHKINNGKIDDQVQLELLELITK